MAPNLQSWMDVLARMEAEADVAGRPVLNTGDQLTGSDTKVERGVAHERDTAAAWSAPQGLGPIPAELVQRARHVEAAQRAAVVRLEEAKAITARHLAAVQSVPEGRTSGRAVFLDVTS